MARDQSTRPATRFVLPLATLLLLGFLIVIGGCGGDEPPKDEVFLKALQPVVDRAGLAGMEANEFRRLVAGAAERLVEHLGGDEAAFSAILVAVDRGYDFHQLLTGSLSDRVKADGLIAAADGSVLAPARPAEGITQPSTGGGDSSSGSESARTTARPLVVASLSQAPLMVVALGDTDFRTFVIAEGVLPIPDVYIMAREMWQEHKDEEGPPEFSAENVAALAIKLVARGYGVQQIVEGILLDQVKGFRDPQGGGTWCYYIEHTSGVILRPVHPPANIFVELDCPWASKDAPTSFSPEEVKAAVAGVAGTETAQGDDAGGGPTTTKKAQEPPSTSEVDIDGIKNGLYTGEVYVRIEPTLLFEILDSTVELDITDDGITATVEWVQRWAGRYDSNTGQTTCIATARWLYIGQGPVTDPLSLVLEAVDLEIVAMEGSACGITDFWNESYEDSLRRDWEEKYQTRTLVGSFSDGLFEGDIGGAHGVSAVIAE